MPRLMHQRSVIRRWVSNLQEHQRTWAFLIWLLAFVLVSLWQRRLLVGTEYSPSALYAPRIRADEGGSSEISPSNERPATFPATYPALRPHIFNITQFGGVGDGKTLNTQAFELAISTIASFADDGGGQLNIPQGVWLTGPFNLTSHMTLFLASKSIILASNVSTTYPCFFNQGGSLFTTRNDDNVVCM